MGNIYIKHYLEHSRNGLHSSHELSISRHNGIYVIIIKKSYKHQAKRDDLRKMSPRLQKVENTNCNFT